MSTFYILTSFVRLWDIISFQKNMIKCVGSAWKHHAHLGALQVNVPMAMRTSYVILDPAISKNWKYKVPLTTSYTHIYIKSSMTTSYTHNYIQSSIDYQLPSRGMGNVTIHNIIHQMWVQLPSRGMGNVTLHNLMHQMWVQLIYKGTASRQSLAVHPSSILYAQLGP